MNEKKTSLLENKTNPPPGQPPGEPPLALPPLALPPGEPQHLLPPPGGSGTPPPPPHRPKFRWIWIVLILLAAVAAGAIYWYMSHRNSSNAANAGKKGDGKGADVTQVVAAKARRGNIGVYFNGL